MKYKVSDLQFYKALQKVEKALEEGHTLDSLEPSINNTCTNTSFELKEAIAELQSNYEAQEIIIADLKKQLEPKGCDDCKHSVDALGITICSHPYRDYNFCKDGAEMKSYYEPKENK